ASDHPGSLAAQMVTVAGRSFVQVEVAGDDRKGALSGADGRTFAEAADHALHEGIPLLAVLASSGADVHDGVAALHGRGLSGRALLRGAPDGVEMPEEAFGSVSGAGGVETDAGECLAADGLGGAGAHAVSTGVAAVVVPDRDSGIEALHDLAAYLPSS